ncbi:unnamed protein product [Linum trigynum]|uniref:GDSL esterase/lipase n=1 Tax=Linum trigynum TaxID=586398 RepID=A0AAV2ECW3_9ROSI
MSAPALMTTCFLMLIPFLLEVHLPLVSPQLLKGCGFSSIYNFGDSLSDTGNALVQFTFGGSGKHPYGMSVGDGKPTGRFSDEYLLIDRIAESAGLPHCNPYLRKDMDHSRGANFAVAGVGLLSKETRDKFGIKLKYSQSGLDEQLKWFINFSKEAFQNELARKANFESALFVLGGGGNDYGGFKIKGGPEEKKMIMPYVIAALKEGLKTVIRYGAKRIVVMGVYQGNVCRDSTRPCSSMTRALSPVTRRGIHTTTSTTRRFNGWFMSWEGSSPASISHTAIFGAGCNGCSTTIILLG